VIRGLANTDYRHLDRAANSIKASIIEACNDNGINVLVPGNFLQQTRQAHGNVMEAFDACWANLRIGCDNLGLRTRHIPGDDGDLFRHRSCGVRVNDQ
jgi:hypothetical protein